MLRWLGAEAPALEQMQRSLKTIVRDGHRVGDIIDRIRALIKKAPPRKGRLDINEAILKVTELTHAETVKDSVSVKRAHGKEPAQAIGPSNSMARLRAGPPCLRRVVAPPDVPRHWLT